MCLIHIQGQDNKYRQKNKNKKFVWCWKVITTDNHAIYLRTPINSGWYKSNRLSTRLSRGETNTCEIEFGIHVCLTRQEARYIKNNNIFNERYVIKCKCYLKDLVSANYNEAVFTKIWIPKEELRSAK